MHLMSQQEERERITDQIDCMLLDLDIDIGLSKRLDLPTVTQDKEAQVEVLKELRQWIKSL